MAVNSHQGEMAVATAMTSRILLKKVYGFVALQIASNVKVVAVETINHNQLLVRRSSSLKFTLNVQRRRQIYI